MMRSQNVFSKLGMASGLALVLSSTVPAQGQILIDFGNNDSYRGATTPNPDPNGNYWNSVWSGAFYPGLLDVTGSPTAVAFGFSSAIGTDYYNGPSGATQDPAATVYNAGALGNLGVNEAVYDYYVTSTFEIQGLDPTKQYNLSFYGAHQFNANPVTLYEVYTDNTYTTLVDSTTLNIHQPGSPWLYNQDTIATISGLSPQTGNILYVKFSGDPGSGGGDGYLNALEITLVPEPSTFALFGLGGAALALIRRRRA